VGNLVGRQDALDVQLALKMIPHADGDPHAAERMLGEARAFAASNTPDRSGSTQVTDRNGRSSSRSSFQELV
jgi:hypothetical protein